MYVIVLVGMDIQNVLNVHIEMVVRGMNVYVYLQYVLEN